MTASGFTQLNIAFSQPADKTLHLFFPQTLAAGSRDSVSIYYHGTPANNGLGSFTKRTHYGNVPVIWTLSEPYGARDWWPCRNGLDDKIDSLDILITHPSIYSASANGVLTAVVTNNANATSHFKHRYPIATYLLGIAVTNYTSFTKELPLQTGTLPVITTVYPEYLDYFQKYIPTVYNALQLYDQYFGPYPFMNERYGQTEFDWGGGMEHQTNSFITNADENLTAHELAHQWYGDKVTCGSWQDIWLNEGFATYLADIFYNEHLHPEKLADVVARDMAAATADAAGSVWVKDTMDINRLFSGNLTYNKGAMLLRMLRWTLGDSIFFKGMNQYLEDPALRYRFARTQDFQRNMEAVSGKSLSYFFNQWFYGKGYPSFFVQWSYKRGNVQLQITETTSDAATKLFALPLQLVFARGTQQFATTVNIQKNITKLVLPLGFAPDSVLIDPSQYIISKNNVSRKSGSLTMVDVSDGENRFAVYPNPAANLLYIHLDAADNILSAEVSILNAAGISVYRKQFSAISQNRLNIPVAQLPSGVYFLMIKDDKGNTTKTSFIKE